MRLRRHLLLASSCLALAACQGLGSVPKEAPRATASVTGSHLDDGQGRVETFRVTEIDGRPIGRGDEPMKTLGVDALNRIDAGRRVHIEFEGLVRYDNPAKSLFWDPRRVVGSVDFVPAAGALYVVRGEIALDGSRVWLEDDASHEVIVRKFTTAPAAPASAPERNL
jgi:hypothetical protein